MTLPARPEVDRLVAAPVPARRVLLIGNPNSGKTTLFNRLCGLRAKTANFPGTTADLRIGRLLGGRGASTVEVIDLPGLYSLELDLPESRLARQALEGAGASPSDVVVVVADATNLVRHLRLAGELARAGRSCLVALNMIDLARRRGLSFDLDRLAAGLGVPVVAVSARRGEGMDRLLAAIEARLAMTGATSPSGSTPEPGDEALESWAEQVVLGSVGGAHALGRPGDTVSDRLDIAFTHPVLGLLIFLAVMAGLFWTLFALATVPMDLIEATFAHLGGWLEASLPAGAVRELLVGGLIGGVSGTVVFLPQIGLLFFLITLLEDTGYLARAAFVMDRLLCRFGLPGYAFVPLLSSHACAIPGILSTRLIPDRHDRFATLLVVPFQSCSARLPVYVLLTSFLFADRPALAGLAFVGCYLLGSIAALTSAALARRSILPGRSRPMVLELPTYKWPSLRVALANAFEQAWSFLRTVGTIIVAICLVMWWLSAYPKTAPGPEAEALRAQAGAIAASHVERAAALDAEADRLDLRRQQEQSFAARLGRLAQPLFAPLGYDWRLTMGVLTSFAAREVFVSSIAVLVGAPEGAETGILARLHAARRDDGTPLLTPATAVSLLIFFVLAMQCLSTLVTVRRETRHWKWPLLQFAWMTGVAWISAFVAFQALCAVGIT
jgi:ferrous iron transport protein B